MKYMQKAKVDKDHIKLSSFPSAIENNNNRLLTTKQIMFHSLTDFIAPTPPFLLYTKVSALSLTDPQTNFIMPPLCI